MRDRSPGPSGSFRESLRTIVSAAASPLSRGPFGRGFRATGPVLRALYDNHGEVSDVRQATALGPGWRKSRNKEGGLKRQTGSRGGRCGTPTIRVSLERWISATGSSAPRWTSLIIEGRQIHLSLHLWTAGAGCCQMGAAGWECRSPNCASRTWARWGKRPGTADLVES